MHSCSPECSGKLAWINKEYTPREARRKSGYIYVGGERQHRLVAENMLGRKLTKQELVHHLDGDKGNNEEDNLYICESSQEHNRMHGQLEALAFLMVQRKEILFCKKCRLYYCFDNECGCGSSFSV